MAGLFGAQANHATGNNRQIVGKILSPHTRWFIAQDIFRPEQSSCGVGKESSNLGIVYQAR